MIPTSPLDLQQVYCQFYPCLEWPAHHLFPAAQYFYSTSTEFLMRCLSVGELPLFQLDDVLSVMRTHFRETHGQEPVFIFHIDEVQALGIRNRAANVALWQSRVSDVVTAVLRTMTNLTEETPKVCCIARPQYNLSNSSPKLMPVISGTATFSFNKNLSISSFGRTVLSYLPGVDVIPTSVKQLLQVRFVLQ